MKKNHKVELNKFEFMVLMFSRAIQKGIKTFFKSTFVKILLLILILSFILICASVIGKSFNYISKGDILYKNIEYESSLENYELANRWWIFKHINPKLQNNSLLIKIRKAQIMVKSTNYYKQGKKDFEESRYADAKLNFSYMAENDPRNSEVEDILLKIQEIEYIVPDSSTEDKNIVNNNNEYSVEECEIQKKEIAILADQYYIEWYENKIKAKKNISKCYDTNPVYICDKQMSDFNIEWQEKINNIMENLQTTLTKCDPIDRFFSNYCKTTVPTNY